MNYTVITKNYSITITKNYSIITKNYCILLIYIITKNYS